MDRMRVAGLVFLLAATGCGQKHEAVSALTEDAGMVIPEPVAAEDGIDWFQGTVDEAFAAAAKQKKPVFLYWGAVWCPPCHELKAYVFSRGDFRDKLRQFIPVYLDGDAPGAQKVADDFGISGYPTVIVARADHGEIARIAGGMDLSRYADALDLALDTVRPIDEIFASLQDVAPQPLTLAECRRLAYNGWGLDRSAKEPGVLAIALQRAAQRCPQDAVVEHDRLVITAAGFAASAERKDLEAGKTPTPLLLGLMAQTGELAGNAPRGLQNADVLTYLGEDYFVALKQVLPAECAQFLKQWLSLMSALESDRRYADPLRLKAVAMKLLAAQALRADGKVPKALQAEARQSLDAFMERTYDEHAHVSMVNSALWVTHYLGDDERARKMLETEIERSKTPYYYMADLADLEEQAGRKTEALKWLEQGYRESRGPATRFQWGTLYVEGLLRMAPDDSQRIQTAVLDVLGELDGPDRIYQRTRVRLGKLAESLREWGSKPGHAAAFGVIADRLQAICAGIPASDPASTSCGAMLAAA